MLAIAAGCGTSSDATPAPPTAPGGVGATPGDCQVALRWDPVAGATSYAAYWGTAPGVSKATGTRVAPAASPWVHSGLSNGTAYHYVVTAVGPGGESAESAEVSATPAASGLQAPAPALDCAAGFDAADNPLWSFTASWPDVPGADGYYVEYSWDQATWLEFGVLAIPGLGIGTDRCTERFSARVTASACGAAWPCAAVSPTASASAPFCVEAPVNVLASVSATSVDLVWDRTPGAELFDFLVRAATAPGGCAGGTYQPVTGVPEPACAVGRCDASLPRSAIGGPGAYCLLVRGRNCSLTGPDSAPLGFQLP
jgi:hypothetical protein